MSIRVVFFTQYLENYGAHDWDGEGECPQYWKPKGGDTYIIEASAQEIAESAWWDAVESCVSKSNDYEREYIISHTIVDEIDFNESEFVEEWDTPTYGVKLSDRPVLACRRLQKSYDFSNRVVGEHSFLLTESGRDEMSYINYEEAA